MGNLEFVLLQIEKVFEPRSIDYLLGSLNDQSFSYSLRHYVKAENKHYILAQKLHNQIMLFSGDKFDVKKCTFVPSVKINDEPTIWRLTSANIQAIFSALKLAIISQFGNYFIVKFSDINYFERNQVEIIEVVNK